MTTYGFAAINSAVRDEGGTEEAESMAVVACPSWTVCTGRSRPVLRLPEEIR